MTFGLERNTVIVEQVKILKLTDVNIIIVLLNGSLLLRLTVIVIVILLITAAVIAALITVTAIVVVVTVIILSVAILCFRLESKLRFINKYFGHIMLSTILVFVGTRTKIADYCNRPALFKITIDKLSSLTPCNAGYKISLTLLALTAERTLNCKIKL